MPYKDREKKREYQREWVKAKRVRHGGFDTKDLDTVQSSQALEFDADGNPIYEEGLCQ